MATTRAHQKSATHARVLDAATQLFQTRGFADTTVRDIAEVADVSPGTVIAVGEKNALLVAVFDAIIAAEHARHPVPPPTPARAAHDRCATRLAALVEPFVTLFTSHPELARQYAAILVSGAHDSPLFTDLADRLVAEFSAAITLRGCTAAADAPATADALYLAYVGTLFTGAAHPRVDRDALMRGLHTTFTAICTCSE